MSAGLPGCGLGGLFFVVCALLAPAWEIVRTVRGRSSLAAWTQTMRQFGLALGMVAAFDLVRRALGAGSVGLHAVAVTAAVLVSVLVAAKGLELALAVNRRMSARAASRSARARRRYYRAARWASDPEG
jgi:hypothetical protein